MKVLPFAVFDRTLVLALPELPRHIVPLDDTTFLLGHATNLVTHHGVLVSDDRTAPATPLLAAVRTVSPVLLAVIPLPRSFHAFATIEPEAPRSALNVLRIYSLSQRDDGTPHADWELPAAASVVAAAVCPETGRLLVATSTGVSLWLPSAPEPPSASLSADEDDRRPDAQKITFSYERACVISVTGVRHVAIHGDYVAYATSSRVRVLECAALPLAAVSLRPPVTDVSTCSDVSVPADDENGATVISGTTAAVPRLVARPEIPLLRAIPGALNVPEGMDRLPSARDRVPFRGGERLVRGPFPEAAEDAFVEPGFAVRALQTFFYTEYDAADGDIHTLCFLPEYTQLDAAVPAALTSPLELAGMRLFASTHSNGRLYNVRQRSLLTLYTYTAPTVGCCVTDSFVYALRAPPDAGLEAFTLRSSTDVAEYDSPPPCLLGTQPFLGPKIACSMGDNIILLQTLPAANTNNSPSSSSSNSISQEDVKRKEREKERKPILRNKSWREWIFRRGRDDDDAAANDDDVDDNSVGRGGDREDADDVSGDLFPVSPLNPPRLDATGSPLPLDKVAWTVYLLRPISPESLFDEIVKYAAAIAPPPPSSSGNDSSSSDSSKSVSKGGKGSDDSDDNSEAASVYYLLILEAHFLLQNAAVACRRRLAAAAGGNGSSGDEVRRLAEELSLKAISERLQRSAGLLGDHFFFRAKQYHKAAQCYSESDRKLGDVAGVFLGQEAGRSALLEYLDRVLFDPCSPALAGTEDADLSNELLHYYVEFAPHRLSTVVLDSALSSYSQGLALRLIDIAQNVRLLGDRESGSSSSSSSSSEDLAARAAEIPPKDLFAQALLTLDVGDTETALTILRLIRGPSVAEFSLQKPSLLYSPPDPADDSSVPDDIHGSRLAQALRAVAPYPLLQVVSELDPDVVPPSVLEMPVPEIESDGSNDTETENGFLEMCYWESRLESAARAMDLKRSSTHTDYIVPNKSTTAKDAWVPEAADRLLRLYALRAVLPADKQRPLSRNVVAARLQECRTGDTFFARWLNLHHNAFTSDRQRWLLDLPPLSLPSSSSTPSGSEREEEKDSGKDSSISASSFGEEPLAIHDYRHFYTHKLEGLLCSGLVGDTTGALNIVERTQVSETDSRIKEGLETLRVLLLPLAQGVDRPESLRALVRRHPHAALEAGTLFCATGADWKVLAAEVLRAVQEDRSTDDQTPLLGVYEDILRRCAATLSPEDFLSILPDDGCLPFFIPFIASACEKQLGSDLRQQILDLMSSI